MFLFAGFTEASRWTEGPREPHGWWVNDANPGPHGARTVLAALSICIDEQHGEDGWVESPHPNMATTRIHTE